MDWLSPALRVSRHTRLISAAEVAEGPQPHRVPCTLPFYYTILHYPAARGVGRGASTLETRAPSGAGTYNCTETPNIAVMSAGAATAGAAAPAAPAWGRAPVPAGVCVRLPLSVSTLAD